jgi:hypothetical protein
MSNLNRVASELQHEGEAQLSRGERLLEMAKELRQTGNVPTAQLRALLACVGFCVVSADALAHAELSMREHPPEDDGPSAHDRALKAITEALLCTTHPRLKPELEHG